MDEKKIEVTNGQIVDALMDIFTSGDLKELVDNNPVLILLAPIIGIKLWDELIKRQEDSENGK